MNKAAYPERSSIYDVDALSTPNLPPGDILSKLTYTLNCSREVKIQYVVIDHIEA